MASGFKMKGYAYPGTSPVKGKKARAAGAEASATAMEGMKEGLSKEYKSSSISAMKLKIDVGEIVSSAAGAAAGELTSAGMKALTKGKKKPTKDNSGATGKMDTKIGGGAKIT